jgi:hypothetical protein
VQCAVKEPANNFISFLLEKVYVSAKRLPTGHRPDGTLWIRFKSVDELLEKLAKDAKRFKDLVSKSKFTEKDAKELAEKVSKDKDIMHHRKNAQKTFIIFIILLILGAICGYLQTFIR